MKTTNLFSGKIWRGLTAALVFGLLTIQLLDAQSWYDANWQYRRVVTVAGYGSTTLADLQVKISLNSNSFDFSQARSDGSDIRVTSDDGTTLIPFWIENWNVSLKQAVIWIKVPSIPVTGTTVCLYYGNSLAASASSGDNTFVFFDDFENWSQSSPGWSIAQDLPVPRADIATAVYDGKLYSFGGYNTNDADIRDETFVYDPALNTWDETKAPMPTERWGMIAVELNGMIYVFGGEGNGGLGINVNERYNPMSDTWLTMPTPCPAELATHGLMGVVYGNKIHLFCMYAHYEYDPVLDTYTSKAPVPLQLKWGTCAVANSSDGTRIYIIGGNAYADPANPYDYVGPANFTFEYNPDDNSWVEKAPMPVSRYGATRENPVINGKIYVTHGHAAQPFYNTNFVYDPMTNTWEQKQPAAYERDGVGCGVINNKLYVVGGRDIPAFPYGVTVNEVYDPAVDTWVPKWLLTQMVDAYPAAIASYKGNYGMVLDQNVWNTGEFTTVQGFGDVYAVDLYWNVRSDYSTTTWGQIYLSNTYAAERLHFFYNAGIPTLRWWSGGSTDLQASTFDNWHKLTIVRNGDNSRVVFDGAQYYVSGTTDGIGQIKFRLSDPTKQYIDEFRVRKWAGTDLVTVVGPGLTDGQALSTWTGAGDSNWNTPGNWSPGLPGPLDYILIPDVNNNPIYNGDLTIGTSASLTIAAGGALTVTGNLVTNGNLTIQSSKLNLSGSLIVNGSSIGNVIYIRQLRTQANDGSLHFVSSPVASNTAENSGKVSTVYQWNEASGTTGAWSTSSMTALQSGIGYNLKQVTGSDGLITFAGPLIATDPLVIPASSPYKSGYTDRSSEYAYGLNNYEDIWAPDRSWINYGGGGWNLLGNPYTSAILVDDFISANYNITPALSQFDPNYVAVYLYDGDWDRYYYIGNSTGWGTQLTGQLHIQAGQGFYVLAMNNSSAFTFNKDMQEHSNSAMMLKSAQVTNRWPGFQLKAKYGDTENLTTVVFDDGMTVGLDPGYDVGLFSSGLDVEVYTALVEDNGVNFSRQALPTEGSVKNVIPVGIDFTSGGELTISAETEPFRNYKFWLEDRATGIFTDLSSGSYRITLPAKTYGTGRFFVHVSAGRGLLQRSNQNNLLDIRIWATQNRQVNIQGVVSDRANCEVFDIRGLKIFETILIDGDYNTFTLPSTLRGVYLVKVTDGTKVVTSKVAFL